MIFNELDVPGAYVVRGQVLRDERGSFTRTFSYDDFERRGLVTTYVQWSVSRNRLRGTLRGMHYQAEPHAEVKLLRCTRGALYDVVLDLRPESPAYLHWAAVELDESEPVMVYVPRGVAHGFQALADDTDIAYHISEGYHPESARGVRWNDPAFGIEWPLPVSVISERDRAYPDYLPA